MFGVIADFGARVSNIVKKKLSNDGQFRLFWCVLALHQALTLTHVSPISVAFSAANF